ncbi:MAG: ferritin-like domain-containing protein [Alphaproteobacteria bacterium]|nr:ferritin-like domain-containing protein [Alphaproteobacteria bacterium]
MAADWLGGRITDIGRATAPDRPARPARPELLPPAQVPRRRINRGHAGRVALLHALAHIELNAVDLAWDIVVRFCGHDLPRAFFDDWVSVAADEARHFALLARRLSDFDAAYGDLPAHDGLWDAAVTTRHDLAARLAVVPMVLEARGLDVTPAMISKLRGVDDGESAAVLEVIYREEVGHVATGQRWFAFEAERRGEEPETYWRALVAKYFRGDLKPPFNTAARDAAGMPEHWYAGLGTA